MSARGSRKARLTMEANNMAAMREALEYASRVLAKWRQDAPFSAWNEYGEAIDRCRAALAKPPRNCDRFGGDIDKLREACARERGLNPEEDFPDVFPDWLLTPSTAKESGVRK